MPGAPPTSHKYPANFEEPVKRQLGVLQLLGQGLTNAELADRLVLSMRTVDGHGAAALAKLRHKK
jgi:DNA-binding NarL/FixJ family response regulator